MKWSTPTRTPRPERLNTDTAPQLQLFPVANIDQTSVISPGWFGNPEGRHLPRAELKVVGIRCRVVRRQLAGSADVPRRAILAEDAAPTSQAPGQLRAPAPSLRARGTTCAA